MKQPDWQCSILDVAMFNELSKYPENKEIQEASRQFKANLSSNVLKMNKSDIFTEESIKNEVFHSLKRLKLAQLCASKAPLKSVMFFLFCLLCYNNKNINFFC